MTFIHKFKGLHLKVKEGDQVHLTNQVTIAIERVPSAGGRVAIITVDAPQDVKITHQKAWHTTPLENSIEAAHE